MNGFEALLDAAQSATRPSTAVIWVALYMLALVFAVAGATKLRRPGRFAETLVNFGVSKRPSPALALAVATLELVVAALLVVPETAATAAAAATALFLLFAYLIAASLRRGAQFACGCFGSDEHVIVKGTLFRALALVAVGAATAAWSSRADLQTPALTTATVQTCAAVGLFMLSMLLVRARALRDLNSAWAAGYRAMLRAS